MKARNIIAYLCTACLAIGATSCSEDEEVFLRRSHDELSFPYLDSTQELLVLSNGRWRISSNDPWITVSPEEGSGDGKTEQAVAITAAQNDAQERTGSITLSNGTRDLIIRIWQEDGFFTIGKPAVAPSFDLYEELVDRRVEIPYQKGKPDYVANVTASLEGPGAEGLAIESLTGYRLEAGDGVIPLKLSGTPVKKGAIEVRIEVEITPGGEKYPLTAESRAKLAGEVAVTLFKVLPRMAVLDWGDYERGTGTNGHNGTPRSFVFELAESEDGPALRRFESATTEWLVASNLFYEHNRFAFGNLTPNTTYWFRIVARELGPNKEDSDITYLEFRTPEEIIEPNTILYKDFDDFCLGGSPIYQAFGTKATDAQIGRNLDPNDPATLGAMHTICNPMISASSLFNYKSNPTHNLGPVKAAALWNAYWEGDKYGTDYGADDYPGWQGYWVRLSTGSVLLSTASVPGYLKTPCLAEIGEGAADITVTCHTAPYFEPYHAWGEDHLQHYIRVEGPGTITDAGPTRSEPTGAATANTDKQVTVICTSNVDKTTKAPLYDYTIPTEHVIKVSGATRQTRIVIEAHPYGTLHYRLHIDDIRVTKN